MTLVLYLPVLVSVLFLISNAETQSIAKDNASQYWDGLVLRRLKRQITTDTCASPQFSCVGKGSGSTEPSCFPANWWCDQYVDCLDESDESNCGGIGGSIDPGVEVDVPIPGGTVGGGGAVEIGGDGGGEIAVEVPPTEVDLGGGAEVDLGGGAEVDLGGGLTAGGSIDPGVEVDVGGGATAGGGASGGGSASGGGGKVTVTGGGKKKGNKSKQGGQKGKAGGRRKKWNAKFNSQKANAGGKKRRVKVVKKRMGWLQSQNMMRKAGGVKSGTNQLLTSRWSGASAKSGQRVGINSMGLNFKNGKKVGGTAGVKKQKQSQGVKKKGTGMRFTNNAKKQTASVKRVGLKQMNLNVKKQKAIKNNKKVAANKQEKTG